MSAKPQVDRIAEREKRRRCRCVHFSGTQNPMCAAGIRYADVEKQNPEGMGCGYPGRSLPCWTDDLTFNPLELDCPSRVLPTEEQLAEEDRETTRFIASMVKGRTAIMAKIKEEGSLKRSVTGKIVCPNCEGGTLHFSYAGAYNGHVHARCSTVGCTSWME